MHTQLRKCELRERTHKVRSTSSCVPEPNEDMQHPHVAYIYLIITLCILNNRPHLLCCVYVSVCVLIDPSHAYEYLPSSSTCVDSSG